MDPNTTMETIGSGANALTKLLEIVNKAFSPRWTRKQADADAYADQRKLQTIRDNPDFCIEYTNGIISVRSLSAEELIMRAEQRERVDIIRQESNIERVLINTARELQGHESVSDEPVDDDWIVRFFKKECTNMKQLFITEVEQSLLPILDNAQMKALHEALTHAFLGKDVIAVDSVAPMLNRIWQ